MEGGAFATVGWRTEPLGSGLAAHIFYAAFLLHGRSGNSKGRAERPRDRTYTSVCRSVPTEHEGFQAELVMVLGSWPLR